MGLGWMEAAWQVDEADWGEIRRLHQLVNANWEAMHWHVLQDVKDEADAKRVIQGMRTQLLDRFPTHGMHELGIGGSGIDVVCVDCDQVLEYRVEVGMSDA